MGKVAKGKATKRKPAKGIVKGKAAKGHPGEVKSTMRRKISALASGSSRMFIGKTSGNQGLKDRFNRKYRDLGYDRIVKLYQTSSEANADKVEAMAIKHGRKNYKRKVKNKVGGGGGADGEANPKFVYAAIKKKKK